MSSNRQRVMQLAAGTGLGYAAWKTLDQRFCISSDLAQIRNLKKFAALERLPPDATVVDLWDAQVADKGDKVAIICAENGFSLSFREANAIADRVAIALRNQGLQADDVVALFANNSPMYLCVFLGILKAGMIASLINSNNKAKPLIHSLEIAGCKSIIYDAEVESQLLEVVEELSGLDKLTTVLSLDNEVLGLSAKGRCGVSQRLEDILPSSATPSPRAWRAHSGKLHPMSYIYTSGTTGLPKACVITNFRLMLMNLRMHLYDVTSDDVTYTCLPLYHSAGMGIGFGNTIFQGSTIVVSRKFSASRFFEHCARYNVTAVQYIGEICRYLFNTPASKWDRLHKVRIAIGNGLRKELWVPFQERFQIPEIGEFYGSTEGNVSLTNHCKGVLQGDFSRVGIVGLIGPMLKRRMQFKIVRHNVEAEAPMRDPETGLCAECGPGEPGELLGFITPSRMSSIFKGYTSTEATEKKILRNVLEQGDSYFRTGDIVRHDPDGSIHFVDRVGDTFRFKGENVATGEVALVVNTWSGLVEANIYGVQVPGSLDGRACMAAVVLNPENASDPDWNDFSNHVHHSLATYAVPHFIRVLKAPMEVTGTLKQRKVDLVKDGIDPSLIQDEMLYLDTESRQYKTLDNDAYARIATGKARL
mmetsp:Transcript_13801/g.26793  ORF Transcript_13801/g.26793 Transcript_13801/m.26793 type:complete len:646 (-) Transcript_13801:77-2014(-)|eukprot:CAMPEP_0171539970 /NCGR_PEP_ID=MMETSP0960-20121227/920_1 /TAXON_ID=87120 /ORGANISM="Aurantiochytrium limacinum, Strain ATCCMYA-1381" /LENGTH=645 /DNA_ID=CAMNT_0012087085 /DNA_START=86 /DNA_END=2023 /DNA_ORIENTATION=-